MTEFKFPCPHCKQRIQCDAGYVGSQINCPLCQQAIIVPPVPPPAAAGTGERTVQVKTSRLRTATLGAGILVAVGIFCWRFTFLPDRRL